MKFTKHAPRYYPEGIAITERLSRLLYFLIPLIMRLLVFGAGGMLGHKLIQTLGSTHDVFGTARGSVESARAIYG